MNPIVQHIANGGSFFSGSSLIVLSVAARSVRPTRRFRRSARLVALTGAAVVACTATPLAYWAYALWVAAFVAWMVLEKDEPPRHRTVAARIALVVLCCSAMLAELPHRFMPRIAAGDYDTMYVIGDSVSAGIGGPEERNWSKLLRDEHGVNVVDLASPGETVESAIPTAGRVVKPKALVFMEIGGNDLLNYGRGAEFRANLEKLLKAIQGPERCLVMMELPSIPGSNSFGMVQRRLAEKYGVHLIPKRTFVDIIAGNGRTVDGIHLTQAGHHYMEKVVWRIVGPAMKAVTPRVES